ncbi:Spa2p [Sugiyamaella lignohabitans]|uniref:Spa2p n=1 Tax=Sugiyamaella lignohabitans TaxID=796027 RepID=A0A167E9E8_9ASCO|nr:Spa2p [Sugiyamaella lignohabitans]ANB13803.1 Spa2p [Sugiyamaella lignohabitans]
MRTLAENQRNLEPAEKMAEQIHALKVEVQEWKSRYSRAKGLVRNLRNSAYGGNSVFATPDVGLSNDSPYISTEGRVRDLSVTKFQVAVDEFLTKSRLGTTDLLDNLHNVVVATRHITQDLNGPDDASPVSEKIETELAQCATLVSKTANQLISTTRNHRISGGMAPISILDAVTSDLSFAVIELIKVAKVRRTNNRDNRGSASFSPKEIDVSKASRFSGNSVTSPADMHPAVTPTEDIHMERSDPRRYASTSNQFSTTNFNIEDPDNTISELQGYLEEQTATAIDSIQSLLTAIKDGSSLYVLRHNMLDIIKLVDITVVATSTSMKQTKNWLLKDKGSYILENLRDCSQRMAQLQEETKNIDGDSNPDRQVKQRLAGIAFDMAKFTKELVKTVEEVSLTSEINHIDNQLR